MSSRAVRSGRGVGRPASSQGESVSDRLLNAATELFSNYEYQAVSIRQVASLAGVNTAMVHYYFGDKAGLYRNMMEKVSLPVEAALNKIAARDDLSIADYIKVWVQAMCDNPWYPIFILKEGVLGEGAFHQFNSTRLAEVMAPALTKALQNDRENGRLRKDLELNLVIMSLVSLLNYPFLVRPLLEKTLDLTFDEAQVEALSNHTIEIFYNGVREHS